MKRDINNLPYLVMVGGAVICGLSLVFVFGCYIIGMIIIEFGYEPVDFINYVVTDGVYYVLHIAVVCAIALFASLIFVAFLDSHNGANQENGSQ